MQEPEEVLRAEVGDAASAPMTSPGPDSHPTSTSSRVFLESLEVSRFRNLLPCRLEFKTSLNVFHGDNAQGKTNLLEAIYLLTALRSFRTTRNRELIRWDEPASSVRGSLQTRAGVRMLEVGISERGRRVRVDGKAPENLTGFGELVKVVLFCPEDLTLIRGAPSLRRDYLDQAISHLYPQSLRLAQDYQKVVSQKNRLLAEQGTSALQLSVWNERQVELGAKLMVARARFVERIQGLFQRSFGEVSGQMQSARLVYAPSMPEFVGKTGRDLRTAFVEALEQHEGEERRRGMSLVGPHRDDLVVELEGRSAAVHCSQGQARLLSLSLKIVELRVLLEERGVVPIMLLDDVSSELDIYRNRYLMETLSAVGCQIFVTTTSVDHIPRGVFGVGSAWEIRAGSVLGMTGAKYSV